MTPYQSHSQKLIEIIKTCLSGNYFNYFDELIKLQQSKNGIDINWNLIKEDFYSYKRYLPKEDQELFENLIELINDYFTKEIKIYISSQENWEKFTEFCKTEKIQYEVIGTYEENEIPDAEINLVTTEFELRKFGKLEN